MAVFILKYYNIQWGVTRAQLAMQLSGMSYRTPSRHFVAGCAMSKLLLFVPAVLALSACASMDSGSSMRGSSMQMNFNGRSFQSGPTSIYDARFGNPQFSMILREVEG
jgi:hypothetical protein